MKRAEAGFRWGPLSARQRMVLGWWLEGSPYRDYDGIIADGAIRSGKTVSLSFSFMLWAMSTFRGQTFALCGKTIASFRRNVWGTLSRMLRDRGYRVAEKRSENRVTVTAKNGAANDFYIFGGKDEASQDLIQGLTLAGVLFDEAALMPESFVNQATARCSVDGSKYWFNCNPEGSYHWFYLRWILRCRALRLVYLHFTMDDNLTLSENVKQRYCRQYTGVFYERFVLGRWVMLQGLVYPRGCSVVPTVARDYEQYMVSMDYGTQNATAMLLWGLCGGVWYAVREYYHSGRETGQQKTDQQYYAELERLCGGLPVRAVIIDPSAASFIAVCRQARRYRVWSADNDVIDGIRKTAAAMDAGLIKINDCCRRTIREFGQYSWDEKASQKTGRDVVLKQNDHSCDAVRYFVYTMGIGNKKRAYTPVLMM